MDEKIKKSYSKLKMSEDSKERIYNQILESEKYDINSSPDNLKNKTNKGNHSHFNLKTGLAACLAISLIVPTGVYAAGKISDYFTVNIKKEKYQTKIDIDESDKTQNTSVSPTNKTNGEPEKYIQVKADFGDDYELELLDSMYEFNHKDGFDAGKDFYYEVYYMDIDTKDTKYVSALNLYDQEFAKDITVNNHKALLCKSNSVQGSRYIADYDTWYNIDLFVFYPEYGYMINYCSMQGLGEKKLISLAESTVVTETKKNNSVKYNYLSRYNKANADEPEEVEKKEVTFPVKKINQKIYDEGFACTVTDVTVSSKVKDTDSTKFCIDYSSDENEYWDKNGKLKSYVREKIKTGDGISQPGALVTGTETIQPKMVYVTMEVTAITGRYEFQLPEINFFEKQDGKYYNTNLYYQNYNRPEKMEYAILDFFPCYFKETSGGKGFWLKNMKKGSKQIYHFAYMVDEDMIDNMVLCFGYDEYDKNTQYVDISK